MKEEVKAEREVERVMKVETDKGVWVRVTERQGDS